MDATALEVHALATWRACAPDKGTVEVLGAAPSTLSPKELIAGWDGAPGRGHPALRSTVADECETATARAACRRCDGRCLDGAAGVPRDHTPRPLRGPATLGGPGGGPRPRTTLVLLDEPTRGLDYPSKERLVACCASSPPMGIAWCWRPTTWSWSPAWQSAPWCWRKERWWPTALLVKWCATRRLRPQVAKVLAPEAWLTVEEVREALAQVADERARSSAGPAGPHDERDPSATRASVVLAVASVLGALAFCWPLFIVGHANANLAHSQDAPWIFVALLPLLLAWC